MLETFGRAGLPPNRLQPPRTATPTFGHGPFSAVLRPSLYAYQRGAYPDRLLLDCLVQPPNPDGLMGVRLVLGGHFPVPVFLQSFRTGLLAVPRRVSFEAAGQADVVSMGLFDEDENLWAWGAILPSYTGPGRPVGLEFRSHQIMVRPLPANGRRIGSGAHD